MSLSSARPNLIPHVLRHMREHGIVKIEVSYEGYGDSGDIENIDFYDASGKALDDFTVPNPYFGRDELENEQVDFTELLQELVWTWLEHAHGGWEINEGSTGHYTLTLDENVLTVANTHDSRYTSYDRSESTTKFEAAP